MNLIFTKNVPSYGLRNRCDQNVDPVTFLQQPNAKGYTLALSFHTVYELGRNFETDDPSRIARGKQLFSYVKQ